MLNKAICKKCIEAYAELITSVPYLWNGNDDEFWKGKLICCPTLHGWVTDTKVKSYERCPYQLEHLMSEKTVC